jgi:hypothetical protein
VLSGLVGRLRRELSNHGQGNIRHDQAEKKVMRNRRWAVERDDWVFIACHGSTVLDMAIEMPGPWIIYRS